MDVSLKNDGGVTKSIIREGFGGKPLNGDKVIVHYIGKLTDGTQFDSSRERNVPFEFTLGKSEVIKGWDEGVKTMQKGELAKIVCTPEYAYGESGQNPNIPPKSTLEFEVELLDFKPEDISPSKDNGILKSIIQNGEGFNTPNDGASAKVHIVGKLNNSVFQDETLDVTLDDSGQLIEGLECAIKKMKKGEKSRIILSPLYAYGLKGNDKYNIPSNSTLTYEVELIDFEKTKENWELDLPEKIAQSALFKDKAAIFFKENKFRQAIALYKKILDYFQYEPNAKGDDLEKINQFKLSSYLNMAMCYLKLNEHSKCIEFCNKALEQDPKSEKSYYRLGMSYAAIKDYDEAITSFQKVLAIDPQNKAAYIELKKCQKLRKDLICQEKQLYAKIFDKMAKLPPLESNFIPNKFPDMGDNTFEDFGPDEEIDQNDADHMVDIDEEKSQQTAQEQAEALKI